MKVFDFIRPQISLKLNSSKRFSSVFGGIVSLTILAMSTILFVLFGKNLFYKITPSAFVSETYTESSKVDLNKFTITITIFDFNLNLIKNPQAYFDINPYRETYLVGKTIFADVDPNFKIVQCEERHFENWKEKVSNDFIMNEVESAICIDYDKNGYFENKYGTLTGTLIDFDFAVCDRSVRECPEDLEQMTENNYIEIHFLNSYVDYSNYESPIKYYVDSISQQTNFHQLKRTFVDINESVLITDQGWIFKDEVLIKYYSLVDYRKERVNTPSDTPNEIYWISFSAPQIFKTHFRSYLKIQDLLAHVGGIINILIMGSKVLFYFVFEFLMIIEILTNHQFEAKELKEEQSSHMKINYNSKEEPVNRKTIKVKKIKSDEGVNESKLNETEKEKK